MQAMLRPLSKTGPTIVNAKPITGDFLLSNNDEITVGERKFLFRGPKVYSEDATVEARP